jgi:hypothetical protein
MFPLRTGQRELCGENLYVIEHKKIFKFPSGPPYAPPITYAVVELSQKRKIAIFTAHFADGASFSEFRPMKPMRPGR